MAKDQRLDDFVASVMQVLPQVIRGFSRTQANALSRGQITEPQMFVLEIIDKRGPTKMGDLAKELSVSLPAMSGLVDRLYKTKCVKRIFTENDRRIINIDISTKGRKILKTIQEQRTLWFKEIFSQLAEQDRKEYLRIISEVLRILNKNNSK